VKLLTGLAAALASARVIEYLSGMSIMIRIRRFLASPQGRRLSEQGRRMAADPRNQQRARRLLARLRRR
jgi:hypothetical protein